MQLLLDMFREPTAHHLCDSGGIYGRAYQMNAQRDLAAEPQATLKISEWGVEFTVSTYHHLCACLELDELCNEFNALGCGNWNSDKYYGIDSEQECWLDDRGFWPEGSTWNTYNWENSFDQILQGCNLERDGETYVLLQVHGGCDARSGYTDAKLFKMQDWMQDYFLRDDSRFDIPRSVAEKAGYPVIAGEHDWVTVDMHGWSGNVRFYDHNLDDEADADASILAALPHQTIEGAQDAVEH